MHEIIALSTAISKSDFAHKLCQMPDEIFANTNNLIFFKALKELCGTNEIVDMAMILKHLEIKGKKLDNAYIEKLLTTNISLNPNGLLDQLDEHSRAGEMKKTSVEIYNEVKAGNLEIDEFIEKLKSLKTVKVDSLSGELSEFHDKSLDDIFPAGQFIKTGFTELDDAVMGLGEGQLITIAGTPGMGKSTFAFQLACSFNSVFFSLEMTRSQLFAKYLSRVASVQTFQVYEKKFTQEEFKRILNAQEKSKHLGVKVYEFKANLYFILDKIKDEVENNGKRLAIIDYVQLIKDAPGYNVTSQLEYITRELKLLAGQLKIPIIILSQLTKDVVKENRQPNSGDLRNSGSIHQDSDMVLFTWEDEKGTILTVDKCREGRVGSINTIIFNKPWSKFVSTQKAKEGKTFDQYTTVD